MMGRIGSIVDDLRALAAATSSVADNNSIGPWLADQLQQFNALPASVKTLQDQVARASAVLTSAGGPVGEPAQLLRDASDNLAQITVSYPGVKAQVDRVTQALLPVMPKIYAGNYDNEVTQALLSNGADVLATLHSIASLLGRRDQAQIALQRAVTSPTIAPTLRDQLLAAMQSGGGLGTAGTLMVGAVLVYLIMRVLK